MLTTRRLLIPLAVTGLLLTGCAKRNAAPAPSTTSAPPASTAAPATTTTINPHAEKVAQAIEKTKNVASLRFNGNLEKTSKGNVPRAFVVQGMADPKARKLQATISGPAFSTPMEIRMLDSYAFVKVSADTKVENADLARIVPVVPTAARPWLAMDTGELRRRVNASAAANPDNDQLDVVRWASDPSAIFNLLGRQLGETTQSGTDRVRGTDTTKYTVTVDVRRALANAKPEEKDKAERAIKDGAPERVTVDVWIDGDGLVRKVTTSVANTHPNGPAATKADVEFFDFGSPVDISQPRFGEVTQLDPAAIKVPPKGGSTTTTAPPPTTAPSLPPASTPSAPPPAPTTAAPAPSAP